MKVWQHLRTINHHKLLVMKHCFKVGLYKQGLLHDMSKYSPTEFLVGCKYYQGLSLIHISHQPGCQGAVRGFDGVSDSVCHERVSEQHL